MVTKPLKRKRIAPPEEINFDFTARHEYLTGFHKRKLQRAKHAQEAAAKKEREDRIEARRIVGKRRRLFVYAAYSIYQLREKRAAEVQRHVDTINQMTGNVGKSSEDESTEPEPEDQEWEGFAETKLVDHDAEYVDEDRYTTVTVETVAVKHDGLHRVDSDGSDNEVYEVDQNEKSASDSKASEILVGQDKVKSRAKRVWTKENPNQGKKKKRKKFRYEIKAERSATRLKEKAKNSAQAKLRRQRA